MSSKLLSTAKRVIKAPLRFVKHWLLDRQAIKYLREERAIVRGGNKIRVGFLCQYIPAWGKYKAIYEQMLRDGRFEPFLLCVPSQVEGHELVGISGEENDTFDYFVKNGYTDAINTRASGKWLNLRSLDLDYVFYPRPYNHFMPMEYHSRNVSRYSRVCNVLYGMSLSKELGRSCVDKEFFRHCFLFFADTLFTQEHNQTQNKRGHKKGLLHSVYCANAALGQVFDEKESKTDAWEFAKDRYRVVWTPRWTTDLSAGGSNFFTYKEFLFDYARKNDDVAFLFRPHPLSLPNFVKTGEMTEEEVHQFYRNCEAAPNVSLDERKRYEATFWQSHAIVTDFSSIIVEYFMTGKPIVYCANNMHLHIIDENLEMFDSFYTVHTQEELEDCLTRLKRGEDPLKEKRREVFEKQFAGEIFRSADKIIQTLVDYSSRPVER